MSSYEDDKSMDIKWICNQRLVTTKIRIGINEMGHSTPCDGSYLNNFKWTPYFYHQEFTTKHLYPLNWTPVYD